MWCLFKNNVIVFKYFEYKRRNLKYKTTHSLILSVNAQALSITTNSYYMFLLKVTTRMGQVYQTSPYQAQQKHNHSDT